MDKSIFFILLISLLSGAKAFSKFSEIVAKDLDNKDVPFTQFDGKCVLVINTASGCGFTKPNMKYLNELTKRHPNLVIIAFPSNSFGQEPKTNEQLKDWFFNQWQAKYHVFAPVDVKTSDVYKFLIEHAGDKAVIWNYGKYIIEKDGVTATRYGPQAGAIFSNGLDAHLSKCLQ